MHRSLLLVLALSSPLLSTDLDGDGLDDALEQTLLEQFLPRFYLSKGECELAPSEFAPGSPAPRSISANGTIYGQAFPVAANGVRRVEIHYHHLWARDCGRNAHPLDAEHVSALIAEIAGKWRAEYWYAAAHEGTVCDVSMGRKAGVEARAEVWISAGKHASFLSNDACNHGGCGSDRCNAPRKLSVARVVNLGERNALMPGMEWAASPDWPLAGKMSSDFDAEFLARLDSNDGLIRATERLRGTQTTLAVGYKPVGALNTAAQKTDAALDQSAAGTSNFIKRAARGVGRFLGAK